MLPRRYRADLLAAEALASLSSSAGAEVVPLAQAALAEQTSAKARIWALTALTAALTFTDRGAEAVAAAQRLLEELSRVLVAATSLGLAHAMVGVTGLFYSASFRLPGSVGRLGRWPGSPAPTSRSTSSSTARAARRTISSAASAT